MDQKLAAIYGTNQPSEADIEKLAAAELAEQLSENDEANIDDMSDEQIEALAAEMLAAEAGDEEQYEEQSEEQTDSDEEVDQETMEKISEADQLGRIMAHAYVQEMRTIDEELEKLSEGPGDHGIATKQTRMERMKELGGKAVGKVGKGLETVGGKASFGKLTGGKAKALGGALAAGGLAAGGFGAKKLLGKKKESGAKDAFKKGFEATKGAIKGRPAAYKDAGRMVREAVTGKGSMGSGSMTKMDRLRALGGAAKKVTPELGALGAAGAAGAYAHHKKKQASALDVLAEQRALAILEENGIDLNAEETETEKVSAPEQELLAQAVEQRAFEMLAEAGYISDEQDEQTEE